MFGSSLLAALEMVGREEGAMKVGDIVCVRGKGKSYITKVMAITDGGLIRIGDRLFHPAGQEMKHAPGEPLHFEKVMEQEVAKRDLDS